MSNGKSLVFAGQGAQFVGMGKDLAGKFPECAELYAEADAVLGYSLSRLCFEGPEEELTRSNHCQPAIFVTSVACYKAFCLEAGEPQAAGAAGLSLGEWSALHVGGALGFRDAIRVLEARGRFMQEACEERDGAMVSVIGLPVEVLESVCAVTGVEMSNLNSAQQTVLSGPREGIEAAEKLAGEKGAKKTVILKVAGAYHSSLMAPAAARLGEVLAGVEISQPALPVLSNVTGAPHGGPDQIRENMVRQVTSPVRWMDCVQWFVDRDVHDFIEFGPGRVLSGLIKRIDKDARPRDIQGLDTLGKAVGDGCGDPSSGVD